MMSGQVMYFLHLGSRDVSLNIIRPVNQSDVQAFRRESVLSSFPCGRQRVLEVGLALSLGTESRQEAPKAE